MTCNCLHPGVINTELGRHIDQGSHMPIHWRIGLTLFGPLIRWMLVTPKKGAQTTIYCVIAPELEKVSGKYFEYVEYVFVISCQKYFLKVSFNTKIYVRSFFQTKKKSFRSGS